MRAMRQRNSMMRFPTRLIGAVRHPAFALTVRCHFCLGRVVGCHPRRRGCQRALGRGRPGQDQRPGARPRFQRDVAEREIQSALAAGDTDLAQSFVELAADRGVADRSGIRPIKVKAATVGDASLTNTAGRFVRGLWTGEPTDLASLAGTAFGDLFVFGDIRDAAREGTRYLTGQHSDPWILGLAGVGLGITAGTYATARRDRAGADRSLDGQGRARGPAG